MREQLEKSPHADHYCFNCHPIHRAISRIIPDLRLVDGNYVGLVKKQDDAQRVVFQIQHTRHSWLLTPDQAIIDAYPVGYFTPSPVLVVTTGVYAPSGGNLYDPDPTVTREVCLNKTVYRRTETLVKFARGWKFES